MNFCLYEYRASGRIAAASSAVGEKCEKALANGLRTKILKTRVIMKGGAAKKEVWESAWRRRNGTGREAIGKEDEPEATASCHDRR